MDKLSIDQCLKNRILVLDGAMGSLVQRYQLNEADYRGSRFSGFSHDLKGNIDLLSLTKPDIIRQIHLEYLHAGADIIETNTFSARSISQADYHLEELVYEMNRTSAKNPVSAAEEITRMNPD